MCLGRDTNRHVINKDDREQAYVTRHRLHVSAHYYSKKYVQQVITVADECKTLIPNSYRPRQSYIS